MKNKFYYNFFERLFSSKKFYRILESIPGLISWSLILLPLIFVQFYPTQVALFALFYAIYWAYNALKFIFFAYMGNIELQKTLNINWLDKLKRDYPNQWYEYYHCTIIPFANESEKIIDKTIESIVNINYPKERKIICLSSEKAIPAGHEIALKLKEKYENYFGFFFITEHELKPGEVKGKASNQNHAIKFLSQEFEKLGLQDDKILVTSNDADMLNNSQYIPYLIHTFLSQDENLRHKRIYQSIPTDYEDFWEAHFFSRIIVSIGAQWRLCLNYRGDYRCTVYSFYSLSLKALKSIGFWDPDIIPEDERSMVKSIFSFGADFKVIPLFITTVGIPVKAQNIFKSLEAQYKQVRRWAWGASEFAYALNRALIDKKISWRIKLPFILNQIRSSTEWVLTSIIPLFGGFIPSLINQEYSKTTYAYAIPTLMSYIFTFCTFLIIFAIIIERKLAPKIENKNLLFKFFSFVHWLLVPYVSLFLSSLPALDAHTRLMFNRRLIYVPASKK